MSQGPLPIAVDAMGGDRAPEAIVQGAIAASRAGVHVTLVGDPARLAALLPPRSALSIVPAHEVVGMDESPVGAVRRKPGASVRVAMEELRSGRARAVVSCGNTGAAMAAALFGPGRQAGVERPAVARAVPRTDGRQLVILDLGANVDCRPGQLAQFALMGQAFARHLLGEADPRVGLLSNGEEEGKGNELVRLAAPLIAALPLRFVGQVEPVQAFRGACEVLVCDGFVGNVMLKTVEATAEVVGRLLKEEVLRRPTDRFGAWLLEGAFARFRRRTDWSSFGGALLLGVEGVVIIGHGRSDPRAAEAAIHYAALCAKSGVVERIGEALRAQEEADAALARGG